MVQADDGSGPSSTRISSLPGIEDFIRRSQQRLQRPNNLPFTVHAHHQTIMPTEKVEIINTQAADSLLRTAL